jgi:regulator of extracellular matrix RemA (YlzA/DUF370 family)
MRILTIKNSVICAALLAVSFSGCAQKGASSCNTVAACEKAVKVDNRDARIKQLQSELAAAQNKPARVITKTVQGSSELYPPNAEPGKCYARVLTPAKYELRTEKMLKSEAGERLQVIPAKYGTKTEKLLVKEASERIVPVPATYKTVTEKILVSPASERIVTIPATYKTVTEKVLVKEASRGWKKGKGLVTKVNGTTGEIMCLVDTPAVYKTVTRQVIATPASTKTIPVPAQYKTVTKRVVATPASTKTIPVPAQYKTVTVKTIVQPATTRRIPIPAKYQTVTKRVKVGSEKLEWKEVKCRTVVH